MLTAPALLVIASFTIGQMEAPPSNYEHLKELEFFVGHWNTKRESPCFLRGTWKQGLKRAVNGYS